MAIPRLFNSNIGRPFLGQQDTQPACEEEEDEDEGLLVQAIQPHLSRVLERGTAQYMSKENPEDSENLYVSIVAQAEGEGTQEFSPSCTEPIYSRSELLREPRPPLKTHSPSDSEDQASEEACIHPLYRKRRKKIRRRRLRSDTDQGPPVIQGLWVQEIDWLRTMDHNLTLQSDIIPPPLQFTDWVADPCNHGDDSSEDMSYTHVCGTRRLQPPLFAAVHDCVDRLEDLSLLEVADPRAGSSDAALGASASPCSGVSTGRGLAGWDLAGRDLAGLSGFNASSSDLEWDDQSASSWSEASDSSCSSPDCSGCVENLETGNTDTSCVGAVVGSGCTEEDGLGLVRDKSALAGLRGRVTHTTSAFISAFFKELEKRSTPEQRSAGPSVHEGVLLHCLLQPDGSMYREGQEYDYLHHIQNGSYGDVICVRDRRTGFRCAAKRVAQRHFSSKEVSMWSALNSPHVVRLLGAVCEGPNVVLFMDLKPGCLAQLVKDRGRLPEDLALYYLRQVLGALVHLHHRRILHLDVKVDNVLLSADGRNTFLCDFGLSEMLDLNGKSNGAYKGAAFPGTETHMAPEVAGGVQRCSKADVWSSCCMLLHMLNGRPPWVRFYAPPLCLKIASEPPPLWEIPSRCNHFTARLLRAGLRKDPDRRSSAGELRKRSTKALRAVGGLGRSVADGGCERLNDEGRHSGGPRCPPSEEALCPPARPGSGPAMCWISPWRTVAAEQDYSDYEEGVSVLDSEEETPGGDQPCPLREEGLGWAGGCDSEVDIYMGEEELWETKGLLLQDGDYEGDWEEEEEAEDEEDGRDASSSAGYFRALQEHFPLLRRGQRSTPSGGSQIELNHLREGVPLDTAVTNVTPEPRDYPPSCLSCSDTSHVSDPDSDHWSDDLSSGVFSSYNSQTDGRLDWLVSANQPSSYCFEGVDIWIEDIHRECLRIRERRRVQVGHVAMGISDQISVKAFTLETLDRKLVSFQQEVRDSGLWLRCIPAPDRCKQWCWRINHGKLELRT